MLTRSNPVLADGTKISDLINLDTREVKMRVLSDVELYQLEMEMQQRFPDLRFHGFLIDIKDPKGVLHVFEQHHPHIVFHAAAYKHVPLLESHINSVIKNNILANFPR